MDNYKIIQTCFGIAIFSFAMSIISPFVCGKRNHSHSCSRNNSNSYTESNCVSEYKEKINLLRKLADTNKNKSLDNAERMKMYKMCGVADKSAEYIVTLKDLEKGIENYLEN